MATKTTRRGFFGLAAVLAAPQAAPRFPGAQKVYEDLVKQGSFTRQRAALQFGKEPPVLNDGERYYLEYEGAGFRGFKSTTRSVARAREAAANGMPREEAVRRLEAGEFDERKS